MISVYDYVEWGGSLGVNASCQDQGNCANGDERHRSIVPYVALLHCELWRATVRLHRYHGASLLALL
jgi:hypothetical protein